MSGLLDRDLSVAETREIRELGRPVLQSVVDTAVGVFERSSQTAGDGDANLGILMPFHHAIEMLDGVEVLLDGSCVVASHTPSAVPLRHRLPCAISSPKTSSSVH